MPSDRGVPVTEIEGPRACEPMQVEELNSGKEEG